MGIAIKETPFIERFYTQEIKEETAAKLGITSEQLQKIYKALKEKRPAYNKGYDYDSILVFLMKCGKEIRI